MCTNCTGTRRQSDHNDRGWCWEWTAREKTIRRLLYTTINNSVKLIRIMLYSILRGWKKRNVGYALTDGFSCEWKMASEFEKVCLYARNNECGRKSNENWHKLCLCVFIRHPGEHGIKAHFCATAVFIEQRKTIFTTELKFLSGFLQIEYVIEGP